MLLDFEKPIHDLETKLNELKTLSRDSRVDLTEAIQNLDEQLEQLKKDTYANLTRWQRVQLSRHPNRPYTLDYLRMMAEEFIELHGDRLMGDDKAMITGMARMGGQTFFVIGQQKGRNTKERQYRNFGMANPEGYRKALRIMRLAEKFRKPILCLIDTPGAYPGIEAEERGQGEAIARNLREMFTLTVPIIAVVIGEGASGGALGIAIGDRVLMLENTWYSVISPESCSSILWRSWNFKEKAAEALKLTAQDMLSYGLIDQVIEEPLGGAHVDPQAMANRLFEAIMDVHQQLTTKTGEELTESRIEKFARMGVVKELSDSQVR